MGFRKSCDQTTRGVCVCVVLVLLLIFLVFLGTVRQPSLWEMCTACLYMSFLYSSGLALFLLRLLIMKCGSAGSSEPM